MTLRRTLFILFALLIAALVFLNCSGSSRKLIPENKFVRLLADIHLADGIGVDNMSNSASPFALDSATLYGSVLNKYRVTWTQFNNTMAFYSSHPDDCSRMYNKVIARLKLLEEELNEEEEEEERQRQQQEQ
jgi:hypothetical protein